MGENMKEKNEIIASLMINQTMNKQINQLINETKNRYNLKLTKKIIYEESVRIFVNDYKTESISFDELIGISKSKAGKIANRSELLNVPIRVNCDKSIYDLLLTTTRTLENDYGFINVASSSLVFWGLNKILKINDWLKVMSYRN